MEKHLTKDEILRQLKAKHPYYLQGKNPKVMEATLEWLTSSEYLYLRRLAKHYGISAPGIKKRAEDICKILELNIYAILSAKPLFQLPAYSHEPSRKITCVSCKLNVKYPRYTLHYHRSANEAQIHAYGRVKAYLCTICFSKLIGESEKGA